MVAIKGLKASFGVRIRHVFSPPSSLGEATRKTHARRKTHRGEQRHETYRRVFVQALSTAVGVVVLAGAGPTTSADAWESAVAIAEKRLPRLAYHYRCNTRLKRDEWASDPPKWATSLHHLSALSGDRALTPIILGFTEAVGRCYRPILESGLLPPSVPADKDSYLVRKKSSSAE
jgi:hypothetical protein